MYCLDIHYCLPKMTVFQAKKVVRCPKVQGLCKNARKNRMLMHNRHRRIMLHNEQLIELSCCSRVVEAYASEAPVMKKPAKLSLRYENSTLSVFFTGSPIHGKSDQR